MNTKTQHTTKYKNSPLGLIPEDWEVKKFKEILEEGKLGGNYENSECNEGVPVMKMGNLGRGVMNLNKIQYLPENEKYNKDDVLKEGDLLFNTRNTLDLVGKVSIWRNELPFSLYNSNLMRMKFSKKNIGSNDFMNSAFNAHYILSQLRGIATGTTSVAAIYGKDLNKVKFILPLITEQKAIADCLCTWDKAIEKQNALIAQKELSKKALMQQLLSGKKRLKGFSDEWKEYQYREILKVVKRSIEWDENIFYKLISVRRRSGGIFYREALLGSQIMVKNLRNVNEGDFLFSKMQIVHGGSALVTHEFEDAKISGSYIACVAKSEKKLNMKFFNWLSKVPYFYHQTYVSSYGVHIEKMTFDFESFLSLKINLPEIQEQTAIANVLQCADDELQLLKKKLDQLKEQKKGLMQVLLTGKKRLKY